MNEHATVWLLSTDALKFPRGVVVRSCSRLLYKLVSEYDATNAPKKHWNVVHFRRAVQHKFCASICK